MSNILCIDADVSAANLLTEFLNKKGHKAKAYYKGDTALKELKANPYGLVICDFRLPDMDGMEIIKSIKAINDGIQIIIVTGYSDVRSAVRAIKQGAFDYVTKPVHPDEILDSIKRALQKRTKIKAEIEESAITKEKKVKAEFVIGNSEKVLRAHKLIDLVAPTDMSVLILGESGTGKEVAAKAIHKQSRRKRGPFIAVDCGALSQELAGSILFGHKKGSFTGASGDKTGLFEAANGGTLFLDEVGNLSYENQIKLLRVLQEQKIRMIGDNNDIDVDVRLIAATNEDLQDAIEEGSFREDLYYRLNEFRIDLPPVRERGKDVLGYAYHFLKIANEKLNRNVQGFDKDVEARLQAYHWPGNLREMLNVIKRSVLLAHGDVVSVHALPPEIMNPPRYFEPEEVIDGDNGEILDLKSVVAYAEKTAILKVLSKTGYNKSRTAEILNVDRKTLYNKISAYNIDHKFR